jgi:outer membrane protein assembly factor BamB
MKSRRALLTALAPLALPLALGGCAIFSEDFWDDLFQTKKTPLPGRREAIAVLQPQQEDVAPDPEPVVLPTPPTVNTAWQQPGGDPTHFMNNLAGPADFTRVWRASIGDGGGYRQMITAQPIVVDRRVFTMDSFGTVRAFSLDGGARLWSTNTRPPKNRSTSIGGGISFSNNMLYAATGYAEVLAIEPASGAIKWRAPVATPARSGPTIVDNRLFLPTVDSRMVAYDQATGKRLWSYDGSVSATSVLGAPAPAVSDGFVICGFGGGDLVALRADSGVPVWQDNLGTVGNADFGAVRGMATIADQRVFATGLGGQTVSFDLHSGRRLWTRSIGGINEPWVGGNKVFMVNVDQEIIALNRDTGATRWVSDLPRYRNPDKQRDPITWFGPTLTGFHLVVVSSDNRMIPVNPVTGAVGNPFHLSGAAQVSPVAAGGMMFLVTADATLTAFR